MGNSRYEYPRYPGYFKITYVGGRLVRGMSKENGLYALFNCDTKERLTEPKFEQILVTYAPEVEYIHAFDQKKKMGILNSKDGSMRIPFEYDFIAHSIMGRRIFSQNGKYGIMSYDFDIILHPTYDSLERHGIIFLATMGEKKFFLSLNGEVISKKYSNIKVVISNVFPEKNFGIVTDMNGNVGIIDEVGKETVPCMYQEIIPAEIYNFINIAKTAEEVKVVTSYGRQMFNKDKYKNVEDLKYCLRLTTMSGEKKYFKLLH